MKKPKLEFTSYVGIVNGRLNVIEDVSNLKRVTITYDDGRSDTIIELFDDKKHFWHGQQTTFGSPVDKDK